MRRTVVALAVSASLLRTSPLGSLDRLWDLLASLWVAAPSVPIHHLPTKEGCGADPSGRCQPVVQPQLDAGCGADPSGRCQTGS
jgi:hypothetical protein